MSDTPSRQTPEARDTITDVKIMAYQTEFTNQILKRIQEKAPHLMARLSETGKAIKEGIIGVAPVEYTSESRGRRIGIALIVTQGYSRDHVVITFRHKTAEGGILPDKSRMYRVDFTDPSMANTAAIVLGPKHAALGFNVKYTTFNQFLREIGQIPLSELTTAQRAAHSLLSNFAGVTGVSIFTTNPTFPGARGEVWLGIDPKLPRADRTKLILTIMNHGGGEILKSCFIDGDNHVLRVRGDELFRAFAKEIRSIEERVQTSAERQAENIRRRGENPPGSRGR